MPTPNYAIVTDGLWRKSLSAVRSLGKSGFQVITMGDSFLTPSFWSKFSYARVLAPVASQNKEEFGKALIKTLDDFQKSVLLPMEDATLNWVVENPIVEQKSYLLISEVEKVQLAQDKARTMSFAKQIQIPIPQTWEPETKQVFIESLKEFTSGNFIVKPKSGSGSMGFAFLKNPDPNIWEKHWDRHGPLIVQEQVPQEGRAIGVSILMDRESQCVAAFAHERLQQYPLAGGPSTDRHGIDAPELTELSIRLLKELKWKGIAMVEWKLDPRNQKPRLMEINPRFWGSLELAVRSGMDFPTLYAKAAKGEKLKRIESYQKGLRCRWLIPGEILRYYNQPRKDRESLFQFLKGLPQAAEEWDIRDLRGFLSTVICTFLLGLNPRYWKYLRRG